MADSADVRRIARALPQTTVDADGTDFRVHGKGFAWSYRERVATQRARVVRADVLAVRVANDSEKQTLLAADPAKFFTTDHYHGYPAVLVRLGEVDTAELRELLTDAWRVMAPRRLVADFEAGEPDKHVE